MAETVYYIAPSDTRDRYAASGDLDTNTFTDRAEAEAAAASMNDTCPLKDGPCWVVFAE